VQQQPALGQLRVPIGVLSGTAAVLVPAVVLFGFAAAGVWRAGLLPTFVVSATLWLLHLQLARLTRSAGEAQARVHELATRGTSQRTEVEALRARVAGHEREQLLAHETTAFALAKLVEARDPSTGVHLERVRAYARLLATELMRTPQHRQAIDARFVHTIHVASPLHDIGKVGIADMILLKPDKLTAEETALMRRHATLGGRTLRAIARRGGDNPFVEMAYDVAMYHHERWDGSGYPFGLAGAHIPLAARIVALCDVYDALTSKRCYKPAFSHAEARTYISEESGKHFDPDAVAAFLAREADFIRIRDALTGEMAIASDDVPQLGRLSPLLGAA
jgi:response regulator RpfG family c-di-GMP phosphodiesterase